MGVVMDSKLMRFGFFSGWFFSLAICLFLSYENTQLRSDKINLISSQQVVQSFKKSKKSDWDIFTLEDMDNFRRQGKVDGKIEALLLMNKFDDAMNNEQIDKIIEIADKCSTEDLSKNNQFLSLLCQAAYHKGISSAEENNKEEYEKGYHKAIEDFTCPETGKMTITPKELDIKKPTK